MNPQAKALANGAKRPAKTSKLNPIAIRSTPYGEFRISPRIAHLKANGVPAAKASERAEAMADYVSKDSFGMPGKADARQAAASMARQARKTKLLSRADTQALVEFARGDQAIAHAAKKGWLSPAPDFHNESAGTMARGAEDSVFRASEIARLARDRGARANPKLGWTRRELAQSIVRDRSPGMKIARSGK